MSSLVTSKGTIGRVGLTMKGKTFGYAGANYPGLLCQSATLTLPTIKDVTRVPGGDGEVNSIRGLAGGTFPMNFYVNYRSPTVGYEDLRLFEGDQVPILHTRESVYADPTNAANTSGKVYGNWINISGLPYGGDDNTGFRIDVTGEVSGCTETVTSKPAVPTAPASVGGTGTFSFTFTGDATKLVENETWNPSDTPFQTVGYRLEYKLAADTDWTVAPAATVVGGTTFDITGSPVPLALDAMNLPTTLHVLNPGALATTVDFTADPGTYDVRAIAVGHFLLESAPVAETGIVVT